MAILIVDDSPDICASLQAVLETTGYADVHTARSAGEAFDVLSRADVDVILMDIHMPHVNGLEACRRIRRTPGLTDVPVLMVTARTDDETLEAAFDAGASDYITKPIRVTELLARVRAAADLKQERDRRKAREQELLRVTHQLHEANRMLRHLSCQDELTGVANRRRFNGALADEWQRALREGVPLSLILVDVDYFKAYNDCYGHPQGDECLRRVAGALRDVLKRSTDLLARYGGEEFVVLLPHADEEEAWAVAGALHAKVGGLRVEHARSSLGGWVSISAGVATRTPERHLEPDVLVAAADEALYQAKQRGRNRVHAHQGFSEQTLLLME